MTADYKSTLFLPQTDFAMRAGLPKREPEFLARWEKMNLYKRQREQSAGREKFILHDGPPYANGHLHLGHALNKILKDLINRTQQMMGKDADYVPGWDCHGLPIEWKIEEQYREKGKDKDQVPVVQFRQECRAFAEKWITVQSEEFQRMGVAGHWDHPYTTMSYRAEAAIARELGKFLMNGSLFKGAKPVLWSVVEKTALAEAEVEYHDHVSTTIFVRFPVTKPSLPVLDGTSIVIWTTTPWTIPGNRAVAYGAKIDYVVVKVTATEDEAWANVGESLVMAADLVDEVCSAGRITGHEVVHRLKGGDLAGTVCRHPLSVLDDYYGFDVPALEADFVEVDTGSGFVHIAPGHGQDDWELGVRNGISVPETVGPDGLFDDRVGLFAGLQVLEVKKKNKFAYPANKVVMEKLVEADGLLAAGRLTHSYPHSWRSKAPLIFRNTPQWFISMETNDLRKKALAAVADTRFVPARGQKRLHDMIAERPDWCVSRQRAWGVPITVFVNKKTGEPLRDEAVMDRVVAAFMDEGADAWFASPPSRFLGNDYDADDFDQVTDILDVWFDSGSTHAFVLEGDEWPHLSWPASLYLEGTDQHRGWFHSSLLEACGTRGRAPYDAILTHGFLMTEEGRKMSKSLGNDVSPQDVIKQSGADILRLWVASSDYTEDLRFGPEIAKQLADTYRRLRNTLRYLLGNLAGFDEDERLPVDQMPELERWVLHRIWDLDRQMRTACNGFVFHHYFAELHNFCAVDLSAFYFDIRKDVLYCDARDSLRRRAARTVLDILFQHLTTWLAPVLCFTAEDAWLARYPDSDGSVHLLDYPDVPDRWRDDALAARWEKVRDLRRVVTGALEVERREKRIGASLQAKPQIYAAAEYVQAVDGLDLGALCITSGVTLVEGDAPANAYTFDGVPGVGVVPAPAEGSRCERCWQVLPEVGTVAGHDNLCGRCAEAVDKVTS